LCAALGALSQTSYRALTIQPDPATLAAVGRAGALLSVLTKVDDQVIDAPDFHGGMHSPRAVVRQRTRHFLGVTVSAIQQGNAPADAPARAQMAAALGRQLRELSASNDRLERLLAVITRGWQIQVEAVALLSAHPQTTSDAQIDWITRQISGAWLLMIAMVGALPQQVDRPLSPKEERCFFEWGGWIQRADSLADLGKDTADGLINSLPGRKLWRCRPEDYLCAVERGDIDWLYVALVEEAVDLECLPPEGALHQLEQRLQRLGEVPALLRWIHGLLSWRYLQASACRRVMPLDAEQARSWSAAVGGARC